MTATKVSRFMLILIIGLACTLCGPFFYLGLIFGFLPVVINTVVLSFLFKKELYDNV